MSMGLWYLEKCSKTFAIKIKKGCPRLQAAFFYVQIRNFQRCLRAGACECGRGQRLQAGQYHNAACGSATAGSVAQRQLRAGHEKIIGMLPCRVDHAVPAP